MRTPYLSVQFFANDVVICLIAVLSQLLAINQQQDKTTQNEVDDKS